MRRVWVAWLLSGAVTSAQAATATALFAGGCFWCLEADFEKLAGVVAVESGYTAGKTTNPTYETVARGHTGHAEAVRVTYDPARVSYPQLVDYFWRQIDPTVKDRQDYYKKNTVRYSYYRLSCGRDARVKLLWK
jgi:peptide-methionine (S)-S-oxide reductase